VLSHPKLEQLRLAYCSLILTLSFLQSLGHCDFGGAFSLMQSRLLSVINEPEVHVHQRRGCVGDDDLKLLRCFQPVSFNLVTREFCLSFDC
jgi:hypothetical protein